MAWTAAQRKAMDIRNKTLLISAAAGSGKTAVLINRIINLLIGSDDEKNPQKPVDISRLLIVTFTKAAALELRQRISQGLAEAIAANPNNKALFKQLTNLGSAHISTIDSFYADVVKKYAEKKGFPASLRLADESEILPIRQRIMNEVLDMGYDGAFDDLEEIKKVTFHKYNGATPFTAFADSISEMRSDSKAWKTLTDLYVKLLSNGKSYRFLLECEDAYVNATISDLFDTEYGKFLKNHLIDNFELMVEFLTDACNNLVGDRAFEEFQNDLTFCQEILDMLKNQSYADVRSKILLYSPNDLPRKGPIIPGRKRYTDSRNEKVKEKIIKFNELYFGADCSEGALIDYAARSAVICRILYEVLNKFDELYSKEKESRGICEFNDIKKWAYSILVMPDGESPTPEALEISNDFDAVYIDEYQDVDPIQDSIFKAISKPCGRFMVGDVKQSIYKFRGAAPSLFINYRSNFAQLDVNSETPPKEDDCTVFMSSNFRCDETVIKFANTVCSNIFRTADGELEYKSEDDLIFAKDTTDKYVPHEPVPAQVVLINKPSKDADKKFSSIEAGYIVSEIQRLVDTESKAPALNKKGEIVTEKISYKDIAVLSRGKRFLRKLGKELDKAGIPYIGEKSANISNVFDDPNVLLTFSLLHAIDNPHKDIYIVGAMMSPLFGFNADDILKLRPKGSSVSVYEDVCRYQEENDDMLAAKCDYVKKTLEELRTQSASLSSDRIIQLVFSKFGLLSKTDGKASSKDALLALYENARTYEGNEFKGLYSYLCYVDNMIENKKTPSVSGKSDNAVRLMTIHGSKGLEFPVCFVASTCSPFNDDDTKDNILYSPSLGVSAEMLDADGFGKIITPYHKALSIEIDNKNIEEEMRLLYVALTRACERLYVTASPQGKVETLESQADFHTRYFSKGSVMNSNNYITWILSSLYLSKDKDFFNIQTVNGEDIKVVDPEDSKKPVSETVAVQVDEKIEIEKEIKDRFEFEYPYLHVSDLPAKLSVSKLSPIVLDRSTGDEETATESIDVTLPDVYVPSFTDKENDEKKISPAERGTATHTFLQFCDFDNAETDVEKELDRLVQDKFIDERMKKAVDVKQLEAFFRSDLFKEIKSAKPVWREQRFNILLPAHAFTDEKDKKEALKDEKLLVQGVIDIFFKAKDGSLVLCDYKTDHLTPAEISDKALASKKLNDAHARQLSYYAEALKNMFGKYPDKILIYSLPLGDAVEISTSPIL